MLLSDGVSNLEFLLWRGSRESSALLDRRNTTTSTVGLLSDPEERAVCIAAIVNTPWAIEAKLQTDQRIINQSSGSFVDSSLSSPFVHTFNNTNFVARTQYRSQILVSTVVD